MKKLYEKHLTPDRYREMHFHPTKKNGVIVHLELRLVATNLHGVPLHGRSAQK